MPILKIKELRENHGMTQMQVAQKLDIPLSTYRSYKTGVREPGVNMLITLSELYGVTTDYLLNYSQKPTALNSDEITESGILDAQPDEDGYVDIDLEEVVAYIVKEAKKDEMGEYDPEEVLFVVQGEMEYGDSLGQAD